MRLQRLRVRNVRLRHFTSQPREDAPWLHQFGASVWHEFSPLALKHDAVNLGQGFPAWSPPPFLTAALAAAAQPDADAMLHQYARAQGHLPLVRALAAHYGPLLGRALDAQRDVLVTAGATEALFSAVQALVAPRDDVVVLSPQYDSYEGCVARAGARLVSVPLRLRDGATSADAFELDIAALEAAVTPQTRMLILNNPHNPTGKMFSRAELEALARIVLAHPRMLVLSDECYEFITYDSNEHIRIATLPGMYERTVTISSAAKTFSCTGWKIGWCLGPAALIEPISRAHSFVAFAIATPLQHAVAAAVAHLPAHAPALRADYTQRRARLAAALRAAGLTPIAPQGTFFTVCDVAAFRVPRATSHITPQHLDAPDWNFCRFLTSEIGVAAIPCSAFYPAGAAAPTSLVRFAFCKPDALLDTAAARLAALRRYRVDSQ